MRYGEKSARRWIRSCQHCGLEMVWQDQGNRRLEIAFITASLPSDPAKREQATWMMLFPSTFPRSYRVAKRILAEEWKLPIWPHESEQPAAEYAVDG